MLQKAEILRAILEQEGFDQVRTFGYTPQYYEHGGKAQAQPQPPQQQVNSIRSVMEKVQKTGYRTIVFMPTFFNSDATEVGMAATEFGLDQGDHLWIISNGAEQRNAAEIQTFLKQATSDEVKAHFYKGAAFLFPYDGYELHRQVDFRRVLLESHGGQLYEQALDLLLPNMYLDEEVLRVANESRPLLSLAQNVGTWLAGASFMFDAVMSIGLGACAATSGRNETTMTGAMHRDGIRSIDFMGASGQIRFGSGPETTEVDHHPGSRVGNTVPFTVVNFIPSNDDSEGLTTQQVESMDPVTGNWTPSNPFIFADGTTTPPPLREQPNQNYISDGAKVVGMCLFGVSLIVVVSALIWVFVNRKHSVVIAGQPIFLYTLCFASVMMCFLILISAFDETWGFSQEGLDAACCTWTWFDGLGRTITYSALFTKVRRGYFGL